MKNLVLFLDFQDPTMTPIYVDTNQKIEKYSKIICFVMGKAAAICFVVPKLIVSFVNYFTTDLGSDAFELPYFMW